MSSTQRPLTIGIVACSAEGAALCYRTICAKAPELLGKHAHPDVVLHSISLAEYVDALEASNLQRVADIMLRSADKLAAAGADFVICPDNTIHAAMTLVRPNSRLPWLHIAEVVAAQAEQDGFKKLGILGTQWLTESEVYPTALSHVGADFLRPDDGERREISRIIMDELVSDIQHAKSVSFFQSVIENLGARGCDAVILGCTEIPLIIDNKNAALPTLDSTRLLAEAALRYAVNGNEWRATDG